MWFHVHVHVCSVYNCTSAYHQGSPAPINMGLHTLRHTAIDVNAVTMLGPSRRTVLQFKLVRGNRGYNTSIFVAWNCSISCSYSTNLIRQLTKHGLILKNVFILVFIWIMLSSLVSMDFQFSVRTSKVNLNFKKKLVCFWKYP